MQVWLPAVTQEALSSATAVFCTFSFTIKHLFQNAWSSCLKAIDFYSFLFFQELLSGSPSRSSSSLSFQSTPPQQSPASFSQPLLNGLGRSFSDGLAAVAQSSCSSLPTVSGLMASVAGIPQLNMNAVLSGLNGIIPSPLGNASQATLPALPPQPPPLNPQALAQGFPFPKSVSPYVHSTPQAYVIIWMVDVWHVCTLLLFVFQIFSLVWAAEAASSWTSAAAAATPADPHLAELYSCNDHHSTSLIHRRSSTAVRMQRTKETVPDPEEKWD